MFHQMTLACLVLSALCTSVGAQNTAGGTAPIQPAGHCESKRSIEADGTIVIQHQDCSITRITKKEVVGISAASVAQPATQETSKAAKGSHEIKPQAPPPEVNDAQITAQYRDAMNGYYEYFAAGYEHRQRVFEWQLLSSRIIFGLVALLVFAGIYFAALQFHHGLRQPAVAAPRVPPQSENTGKLETSAELQANAMFTTFSASARGIQVSSPVLGVVILVISLAFFYLYLVYVYPITELF